MKKVLLAILIILVALPLYAADVKESDLPVATSVETDDYVRIIDSGASKQITLANFIKGYIVAAGTNNIITYTGNYTLGITLTNNTAVTFPTSGTLAVTGGALGTPSFTALNMPSSNADPGTTAGQIRHDSTDTGSNSGGTAKWYDGAQVRSFVDTGTNYTIITKTEFIPIRYAEDGSSAPSAAAAVTGKNVIARSFSEGDDVVIFWVVPNDYIGGGSVKYRVHYALSANASADETVIFSMTGCVSANSADIACSAGTALTATDELGTDDDQYQYMVTDYTAASNADWGITAGGFAKLAFSNSAAGDLTSGEPLVIGIEIKYQAKIMGFSDY